MTTTEARGPVITERAVPVWNGQITLRVKVAGAGAPLLYLHPAGGLLWDSFLSHLAQSFTVYAPEFPGTSAGDPYAVHAIDGVNDLVLVYEGLVRTLGLKKPIVVGQSFGGMLAAELSATFPDLPGKVVLLDPIGLWREDMPTADWMSVAPAELPALLFHDPGGPAAQSMLTPPEDPELAQAATAAMIWSMGVTAKFIWPIPDRGLRTRLHRISSPVLLVWGAQDRLISVNYVAQWQAALADCRAVVIDECGHIPQIEKPDETIAAVNSFFNT